MDEFAGISQTEEQEKYEEIKQIADRWVVNCKQNIDALKHDLKELQDVYDLDEKEGLAQWFYKDARFQEVRQDLLRAERAGRKPYFGRIDFIDDEVGLKETYYMGKSVIADKQSEPIVIDWRAPVSSIYYEQNLGKCSYKVPGEASRNVDLKRKRTYEITEEGLQDFYDSEVVANDELLTKYLSKGRKSVLSEIIATIQQEQNTVIRKNPHHNVLIQGGAGSGKTTVAMHRISYILYNFAEEFAPADFYIIGSNKVLLNYITGVLPDLDVYDVPQMTMEELFVKLLYEEWKDSYRIGQYKRNDSEIGIKGTSKWFEKLTQFCTGRLMKAIPSEDIVLDNNRIVMKASEIDMVKKEYEASTFLALSARLNDLLISRLEGEIYGKNLSYDAQTQKNLLRKYRSYFNGFLPKDTVFSLYEDFVNEQLLKGVHVHHVQNKPDLYDLAALAYIYKRLKETTLIREAAHVVIDEAQDFGIAAYASLKYCLSKCTFTIMGDVSQNINFGCGLSDWEELRQVMLPDPYDYFGLLRKSYRNTIEISHFATDILAHGSFKSYPVEPIIRHGEKVRTTPCTSEQERIRAITAEARKMIRAGHETIGVICATNEEALRLYASLKWKIDVGIFSDENTSFAPGVTILPIEYAKGLEFDAVIIANASSECYPAEDGYVKLLYVAATRALHELSIFYCGSLTSILADPVDDSVNRSFSEDDFHLTPNVMEEDTRTTAQVMKDLAKEGHAEMKFRDKYGPKRIQSQPATPPPANVKRFISGHAGSSMSTLASTAKPVQQRVKAPASECGSMPSDTASLRPVGHGRIDNAVRWVNAGKNFLEITGSYGVLTLLPEGEDGVRVIFRKGNMSGVNPVASGGKWNVIQGRDTITAEFGKGKVSILKKTGQISFLNSKGEVLLSENPQLSRQFADNIRTWWNFFAFGKKEYLKTLADNEKDWINITTAAKYISHTRLNPDQKSILLSMNGYQIEIPAGQKALVCTINAYSPHIKYEDCNEINYVFRVIR